MKVLFKNRYLEELFEDKPKGKPRYNEKVIIKYRTRVNMLMKAEGTNELRLLKNLHFERLTGDKSGLYSIRVDKRYRIEFTIDTEGTILVEEIITIKRLSNHYK